MQNIFKYLLLTDTKSMHKRHVLQNCFTEQLYFSCIFIIYWLTKHPLTPLHKDAVIGEKSCF